MSDQVIIALSTAILAALPPTIVALAAVIAARRAAASGAVNSQKLDAVHVSVNGRLTQLLEESKAAARAEGFTAGQNTGDGAPPGKTGT